MKIASIGVEKIAELICDDKRKYLYRSLNDLENLFYGNTLNTEIFKENSNLSRKKICIKALNNIKDMEKLLKDISDIRNFKDESTQIDFINELNSILSVDELKVIKHGKKIKVDNKSPKQNTVIHSELFKQNILSTEYVNEQIKKAKEKIINEDYSGAITNARTLLEQIIRDLCVETGIKFQEDNLKKNFDELRKKMHLNPQNYEEDGFKKIISGLINSVDGIFEVRNKCSDSHSRKYNPNKHHAKLCINGVLTISEFLVESYLYQKKEGKI